MKTRVLFTVLVLQLMHTGLKSQLHDHLPGLIEQERKAGENRALLRAGSRALNNYDIKYHRLEWKVDPAVQDITGKVTTYFVPTSSILQMEFDLTVMLTVDSVVYHGSIVPATQLTGDILQVDMPGTLAAGVLDSVSVYYQGAPPTGTGMGAFATSTHAGVPVMWTLSQPYGAKDWWPCKQDLQDKIDSIDVFITHPSVYRASSNGILVSETPMGSFTLTHWKHRSPIAAYLIAMAVTNYVVYTHSVPFDTTNTQIINYIYPEDSAALFPATYAAVGQMQLFDSLFGVYPFYRERYGHTEFGWGGGMEHQTNSFMGNFNFEIVAHELAHQWFGDYITCGSWHHVWLNEGFATYLSGLCYEHILPMYWQLFKQNQVNKIVTEPDGSVYCDDTVSISRIFNSRLTYSKGCMILNSLRWVLGDSLFFAGMRNYATDPALAFGFSRFDQFKAHMEAVSGQDLTWYFNDWYFGEGFPTYHIQWEVDASNQVTVQVNQIQSHSSVDFFEMPLPLYFKNATQDTTVVINHTMNGEMFSFPLMFKPDTLKFDPEFWIISAFNLVSGMLEPTPDHVLNIYPTVATSEIIVSLDKGYPGQTITITSAEGKMVLQQTLDNFKTSIPVNTLARGVYQVTVRSNEVLITKKFIKQ